ncbi:MAG: helix-turn-helix transcriptional regulator [Clostridiales bacterium]|nr:helix-turn-helix transcriptional regulator [Clostridiales bacterium]
MPVRFDEIQMADLALMHVRALELKQSPMSIVHYEGAGREDHLLYYHISGSRLYRQDDREIMIPRPGDILLLPKGSNYSSTVLGPEPAFGCMTGFLLMNDHGEYLDFDEPPQCIYHDEEFRLLPYFQDMTKHFKRSNTLLFPKATLSELMDELIHNRQRQLSADDWLAYAVSYMGRHLDAPLTLALLAEKCHMSERTFSRKFKAAMDVTPIAYHRRLRIQKAKEFLSSGAYTLEATAEALGFTDAAHLSRSIFQETGVHAGIFRRRKIELAE